MSDYNFKDDEIDYDEVSDIAPEHIKLLFPNPGIGRELPTQERVKELQDRLGFSDDYAAFLRTQNGADFSWTYKELTGKLEKYPAQMKKVTFREPLFPYIDVLFSVDHPEETHNLEYIAGQLKGMDGFFPIGYNFSDEIIYVEVTEGDHEGWIAAYDINSADMLPLASSLEEFLDLIYIEFTSKGWQTGIRQKR